MESDESAGGAADFCPAGRPRLRCQQQRVCTKRHLAPSLAAGRRPFSNSPARLLRRHSSCSCPCVAAVPARVAPCTSKPMRARAMARDVRNQPAIATRFLS
jgi:hypothetical protein